MFSLPRLRRWVLWAGGILACLYAAAVFSHSLVIEDFGLSTAFSTRLNALPREFRSTGINPKVGDELVRIADLPVETWADAVNAPAKVRSRLDENGWDYPWVAPADQDDSRPWIEIELRRSAAVGNEELRYTIWCPLGRLPFSEMLPSILWGFLKLVLFVVGILVVWKRPEDPAAVQFFALCFVTLAAYIGGYHWMHMLTSPPLVVGFMAAAVYLAPVALHFYLVFPTPTPFFQRNRGTVLTALYGIPAVVLGALLWKYVEVRTFYHTGDYGVAAVAAAIDGLKNVIYAAFLISAVFYALSLAALTHSLRHTTDKLARNQIKCIFVGACLSLIPIAYSLYLAYFRSEEFGAGKATWPMFGASVIVTAAFVVGITRYRLMELDQLISSSASYFLISFLVGLVYYAVVFIGTLVFNQALESPISDALKVSTVALVLLLVLDIARGRLKRALDHRFHREKYHLDRTLQRMGEAVKQMVDPAALMQKLLHATVDLLVASRGAVYLKDPRRGGYHLVGWAGPAPTLVEVPEEDPLPQMLSRSGPTVLGRGEMAPAGTGQASIRQIGGSLAFPLTHEGEMLAFLILGQRRSGASYRQEDLSLLDALAQITVLALANAAGHETIEQLNSELRAKVEKIAEQQRRILALQAQLQRLDRRRTQSDSTDDVVISARSSRRERRNNGTDQTARSTGIIGSSVQLQQVLRMVEKVAKTDAAVLIRGESGTGKELLAEAIHSQSDRCDKPFIKVHCAALSPSLLESELFGHVKGAFTGALRDKIGRFELANGGTIFLDEIGDISKDVQTKLLRVLQEKTFERVGSSESMSVDVRVLAATHQDLESLIAKGRFREDLFYRLNVFPITVPPLRERKEDIIQLARYFVTRAGERTGNPNLDIDEEALQALQRYDWPGNVRQLENVIQRAVVLVEGDVITLECLPREITTGIPGYGMSDASDGVSRPRSYRTVVFDREDIETALMATGGNKAQAARHLGIPRSTLISRMKKLGML